MGGMLSIGNTKPDKINDGNIVIIVATEKATCCESDITETKIPMLVEAIRKINVLRNKSG